MKIEQPVPGQIPQLLQLWKDAFGDWDGFWECFLETAFQPERCLCITEGSGLCASLCWFDVFCEGQKMAYIYAVVTHPDFRGRGLCARLMDDTHEHLARQGYTAALLLPAEKNLRGMYRKMGYEDATWITEFSSSPSTAPCSLRAIGTGEYAALRRQFLPEKGVIQERENLTFLAQQAQFYTGAGFLLAAYTDGTVLHAMELLGDSRCAPDIVAALGCTEGHFRVPGSSLPFAMFHPLQPDAVVPQYFGFPFD